nr:hypothetical protein CFP56_79283 [Quercus suber]
MLHRAVRGEPRAPAFVLPLRALQVELRELRPAHTLDQPRRVGDREQRPMIVRGARAWVREDRPLLHRRHDIHEHGGADPRVRRVVVDEQAMSDARAAVVSAPQDLAIAGEDAREGFEEQMADGAFVAVRRQRREPVPGQFGDEERDSVSERTHRVSPHVAALRPAVDHDEHGSGAGVVREGLHVAVGRDGRGVFAEEGV